MKIPAGMLESDSAGHFIKRLVNEPFVEQLTNRWMIFSKWVEGGDEGLEAGVGI